MMSLEQVLRIVKTIWEGLERSLQIFDDVVETKKEEIILGALEKSVNVIFNLLIDEIEAMIEEVDKETSND